MSYNSSYYCPITGDLMSDPVVDKEGNTFERVAIEVRKLSLIRYSYLIIIISIQYIRNGLNLRANLQLLVDNSN